MFPCSYVISINLGNNITSIGDGAFYDCIKLTNINIPNSVTSIGTRAFNNCSDLSHVCYLGSSDPGKSSTSVFDGCNKLDNVIVIKDYTDISFCGMPISKRETYVEIKLDDGVKVNEIDVNEFVQIMCETSGNSKDNISVEVKTDDNNNVICILVYVNDEQTANKCIKQWFYYICIL